MIGATGPTRNTNVTLNELKQMVAFAEEHGGSEFKTITLHTTPGCGLDHHEVSREGGRRTYIDADPGCM